MASFNFFSSVILFSLLIANSAMALDVEDGSSEGGITVYATREGLKYAPSGGYSSSAGSGNPFGGNYGTVLPDYDAHFETSENAQDEIVVTGSVNEVTTIVGGFVAGLGGQVSVGDLNAIATTLGEPELPVEPIVVTARVQRLGNGFVRFRNSKDHIFLVMKDGEVIFESQYYPESASALFLTEKKRGSLGEVSGKIARSKKDAMGVKTPTSMLGDRG